MKGVMTRDKQVMEGNKKVEYLFTLATGGGGVRGREDSGEGRTQGKSHTRAEEKFDISGERLAVLAKGHVHSFGNS